MPNSYTAVPTIIPGNLTVTGNLTVGGSSFKLGQLLRKFRIQEVANGQFVITSNLDAINVVQDDPANISYKLNAPASGDFFGSYYQPAGVPGSNFILFNAGASVFTIVYDEIRLGVTTPYVRLAKNAATIGQFSVNLQKDLATRDDAAKYAYALVYDSVAQRLSHRFLNLASALTYTAGEVCLTADPVQHTFTGAPSLQTLYSHTITAGILSPVSSIHIRLRGKVTTAAGGSLNATLYLGGATLANINIPQSLTGAIYWDTFLVNANSSSAQQVWSLIQYPGITPGLEMYSPAVDTTVDQVLQLQYQTGIAADSVTWSMFEATLLNNFTPT